MASVDMSLDEIIAKNKKNGMKNTGAFRREGFKGGIRGTNKSTAFRGNQRGQGYIDYDAPRSRPKVAGGGGNPNKIVRINISNLAPSVVSPDLEELFADYNIETATVHYNETGISVGTADIFLRKRDAEKVLQHFKGVALDGQVMKMLLVDGTDTLASRIQFLSPRQTGGGIHKSHGQGRFRGDNGFRRRGLAGGDNGRNSNVTARGRGRDNRPRKTEAELDAELDAYMSKSKGSVV